MKKSPMLVAVAVAAALFAADLPETAPKEFREVAKHPFFKNYQGLEIQRSKKVGAATMFRVYDPKKRIYFNLFDVGGGYVVLGEAIGPEGRLVRFAGEKEPSAALSSKKREKSSVDMAKYDTMAAYTFGEGDKDYYLFTDPECPYCRKLENFSDRLGEKGRFHVFFYPLDGLHPTARKAAAWIMDLPEEERAEAMRKIALGGDVAYRDANVSKEAYARVAEQKEVGREVGVNGTPTVLDANGSDALGRLLQESGVTSEEFRNAPFASARPRPTKVAAPKAPPVPPKNPDRVDPGALKALVEKGAVVAMGEGDKDIFVFMSTRCPHCRKMFSSGKLAKLQGEYRFHFVLDPSRDDPEAKYMTAYVLLRKPEDRPAALLHVMTEPRLSDKEKREVERQLSKDGETAMRIAFIGFVMDKLGIVGVPVLYDARGDRVEKGAL